MPSKVHTSVKVEKNHFVSCPKSTIMQILLQQCDHSLISERVMLKCNIENTGKTNWYRIGALRGAHPFRTLIVV